MIDTQRLKCQARTLLVTSAFMLVSSAQAQDGSECFSKFTKYNVCEKAREIQREAAPSFPIRMNANITISMIAALGPRLIFYATWHRTKPDLDASLGAGGTTMAALETTMTEMTRNAVCSQEVTAAFVRLGGQMQYVYNTQDGHVVLAPVVTSCAPPKSSN